MRRRAKQNSNTTIKNYFRIRCIFVTINNDTLIDTIHLQWIWLLNWSERRRRKSSHPITQDIFDSFSLPIEWKICIETAETCFILIIQSKNLCIYTTKVMLKSKSCSGQIHQQLLISSTATKTNVANWW